MKQILLALSIFFCIPFSYSEPVSRFRAQKIATQLLPQAELLEELETPGNQKLPYFIFTNKQSNSFVILAGDDQMEPILGYSDASVFDFKTIPPALRKLLEEYAKIARYALKHPAPASQSIQDKWESLEKGNTSSFFKKAGVNPLIASKWDQSPYYNALCPLDATANERTVSGCVATAMAMVLKYWNYPAQGTGFHSYNHPKYGTLSANFANTTYNWSAMPNTVSSSNSAVATLMYHCGVSVDMNYGIGSTGGSGAYVISSASPVTHCTEYALKNYFGYKNTLQGLQRKNYTDAQWLNLLKAELEAQRPIIYAGFGSGGGHCFLVDGYDNSNKLHINWGWSGAYDGYFSLNAFNPDGLGTGGGTGEYTSGHQAVIGIQPSSPNPVASDLRLYSALSINPASISLGQSFSVSAQIANYATQAGAGFSGDLCAAVFNSANQHVAYVEIKAGITIDPNFYNSFQFSTTGISNLTPGNYTISLFWKKSGTTQWQLVSNGQYANSIGLTVQGNSNADLNLYAPIVLNPNLPFQNKNLSVQFDVLNKGTSAFSGSISIDLHGSDGEWIRELGVKSGLNLPSNYHFTNGLTFSLPDGLPDEPGSYQLFVWYQPTGGGWTQIGSGSYSNPLGFQLQVPGLSPDGYEPNNGLSTASPLALSFSQNTARVNTNGTNCHVGNDYDYFRINLPAGYRYELNPRLQDSYSENNGKTYTLDALFSYSSNGTDWSESFDDVLDGPILLNGPSTLYVKVSPYFTGETGTYELDIPITRTLASGLNEEANFWFKAYPNPAKELLIVEANEGLDLDELNIFTLDGQLVMSEICSSTRVELKTTQLASGVYVLQVKTQKGLSTQKIVITP